MATYVQGLNKNAFLLTTLLDYKGMIFFSFLTLVTRLMKNSNFSIVIEGLLGF